MLFLCQPCRVPSLLSNFSLPCYNLMLYSKKSFISFSYPRKTPHRSVLGVNARVWVAGAGAASCGEEAANCPVPVTAGSSRFGKLAATSATQGACGAAAPACLRESSSCEGPQLRVIRAEQGRVRSKDLWMRRERSKEWLKGTITCCPRPCPRGWEWPSGIHCKDEGTRGWEAGRRGGRLKLSLVKCKERCFPTGLFHGLFLFFPQ